jgi:AraC family transcriptional regulator
MDIATAGDSTSTMQIALELLHGSLRCLPDDHRAATQLIARACQVLQDRGGPSPETLVRGGLVPWQIRKVKAHVDANLGRTIGVAELAALVRLCPSYFRRAFKKSFGVSPHAFVMRQRVQRAQTLMLTTQDSLCHIALAAGFSDQSHLTARFHRAVGAAPSAWRRRSHASMAKEPANGAHPAPVSSSPG